MRQYRGNFVKKKLLVGASLSAAERCTYARTVRAAQAFSYELSIYLGEGERGKG